MGVLVHNSYSVSLCFATIFVRIRVVLCTVITYLIKDSPLPQSLFSSSALKKISPPFKYLDSPLLISRPLEYLYTVRQLP